MRNSNSDHAESCEPRVFSSPFQPSEHGDETMARSRTIGIEALPESLAQDCGFELQPEDGSLYRMFQSFFENSIPFY